MPFDGADFPPRRDPPRRATADDNIVTALIIAIAFCLLMMPFTLGALVSIVRYLRSF